MVESVRKDSKKALRVEVGEPSAPESGRIWLQPSDDKFRVQRSAGTRILKTSTGVRYYPKMDYVYYSWSEHPTKGEILKYTWDEVENLVVRKYFIKSDNLAIGEAGLKFYTSGGAVITRWGNREEMAIFDISDDYFTKIEAWEKITATGTTTMRVKIWFWSLPKILEEDI